MSQPRFAITAHLGRTGGIDRFLADFAGRGGMIQAHLLWVSGPENARTARSMLAAAQSFKEHRHPLLAPVLGSTSFSGGTVVLMEAAVMLDLNSAASGDLPEPGILEVGSQTAALMAHLTRVPSAAAVHRNLSVETVFLTREGRIRIDPVLAAAGSWPLRSDVRTMADPPDAAWSLGWLIVELLGGARALEALSAAMASASTPAMHRSAVKRMLSATRASSGLAAVTLDLLEWYGDRRTPVDEAARRLMRLGPDARTLVQWADRLPQVAWGWRDDAHPMVGIGTLDRGGQGAAGARAVERVRPTGRGSGRRLLDRGESTDFLQDQRFASGPAPGRASDPLDHFPSADPENAATVLDGTPALDQDWPSAPPPPPMAPAALPPAAPASQGAPYGHLAAATTHPPASKPSMLPLLAGLAVLALLMAGGLIGLFCVLLLAWLMGG